MRLVAFAVFIRNVKGQHHECRIRLGPHVKVQDAIAKARGVAALELVASVRAW